MDGFDEFWKAYPRRIGKLAAIKAYKKARALATAADILAGVEQYKKYKPGWQQWAHASSWLNAGRWTDEYHVATTPQPKSDAYEPYVPVGKRKVNEHGEPIL